MTLNRLAEYAQRSKTWRDDTLRRRSNPLSANVFRPTIDRHLSNFHPIHGIFFFASHNFKQSPFTTLTFEHSLSKSLQALFASRLDACRYRFASGCILRPRRRGSSYAKTGGPLGSRRSQCALIGSVFLMSGFVDLRASAPDVRALALLLEAKVFDVYPADHVRVEDAAPIVDTASLANDAG